MLAKIEKKTDSIAAKLRSDSFEPKVSAKGRMYFTIFHFANKRAGTLLTVHIGRQRAGRKIKGRGKSKFYIRIKI